MIPRYLVDPVGKSPLQRHGDDVVDGAGRVWRAFGGGWDLRPDAGDDNKAVQADIYDARLGESSNFDHPHNLMLVHQRALLEKVPLKQGDRVLEIGGHRSGLGAWLERTRGVTCAGLDISPVWVQAQNAAAKARKSETLWVLGDAERLPFADKSFQLVVSFDVFEHLSDLDRGLSEAFRVLAPGGHLLVHMPVQDIGGSFDGYQRWKDPADYAARQASVGHYHERMPTRSQMRTRLESTGFHVLDLVSFNVWVQPLHDHRFVPLLGKLKNMRRKRPAAETGNGGAPRGAQSTSGFTRVYARTVVPVARVLSAVDRVGSALGIGGSASFVAVKPGV